MPYSRAYSTVWQAPGSLPAFLAGTNGHPMAWHIYVKNSGTYVGNSYVKNQSEPSFYIFLSNMADVPQKKIKRKNIIKDKYIREKCI